MATETYTETESDFSSAANPANSYACRGEIDVLVSDNDDCSKTIQDQEIVYWKQQVKAKAYKSRIKRIAKISAKTMRKAEHYLTSAYRVELAAQVQECARKYKDSFHAVETICDEDMTIPGSMAQVQSAMNNIRQGRTNVETRLEFVRAAEDLIALNQASDLLEMDGVPCLVSLELSRRILDADLVDSKERLVPG